LDSIDVDTDECLAILAFEGRTNFAYVFLREVTILWKQTRIVVDRGFWYLLLQRLKYRHETFGERDAVERFFFRLKEKTKNSGKGFHY